MKHQKYQDFSSVRKDRHEHVTDEQILVIDQNAVKKQAEPNFSLFRKAFEE